MSEDRIPYLNHARRHLPGGTDPLTSFSRELRWAYQFNTSESDATAPAATGPPWDFDHFGKADVPITDEIAFTTNAPEIFSLDATENKWKVPVDGARYMIQVEYRNIDVPMLPRWWLRAISYGKTGGALTAMGAGDAWPPVADMFIGHLNPIGTAGIDDFFLALPQTGIIQASSDSGTYDEGAFIGLTAAHEDTGGAHLFSNLGSLLIRLDDFTPA